MERNFASPTFPKLMKPSKGRRRELTEEENDEIKEAFELFDNDKDNELDYHEFKVGLRALGFDIHKAEAQKLMRDYDRQGKNKITYQDFHEVAAEMMLQRDSRDEVLKAFKLFDDDEAGKISLKKLRRVARELDDNVNEEELKAMIDEFDLDGDGEINFDEFLAMLNSD
ncbi:unnamed protein product [Adineta steineri]|uniref:EF-hand domain-containing protein n=1 Tax=Adineta steineri TaxID=433720 RepID=A0A815X3S6_9BILA|nr:unnamed protein product [Adineta steineri]CAF1164063.1 unnamed protein product [Adineta steineri]CAF1269564.1 unnamed protein product [Adineta steineri]CAF1552919.1 unnamed protein product [Adineta steineri]